MYCPNCGKEIEENAKFCGACGTKLEVTEQVAVETPAPVEEQNTPATQVTIQPVQQNKPAQKKGLNGFAIAGIVIAGIVLINALMFGADLLFTKLASPKVPGPGNQYINNNPGDGFDTDKEPDGIYHVGENVYASFYQDDETMIISGIGDMSADQIDDEWYDLKEEVEILKIEEGVTSVQECNGFSELKKIYIPSSVKRFGIQCFAYNGGLDLTNVVDVYYDGTQEEFYMIEDEAVSGKGAFWGTNCEFHFTDDDTEYPEPTSIPGAEYTREAYIFGPYGNNGYTVYDDAGSIVTIIPNGSKVRLIKSEQRPFLDVDTYYDWWYVEYNGVYAWVVELDLFEIGKEFKLLVNADGGLFLRSGPGQDYNQLALIDNYDIVTVIAIEEKATQNGRWAHVITSSGLEGYCSADYLANQY